MGALATMSLLRTNGLTRHFGGLKAVDGVDFELPEGEIRAIIGPNGAGKTTFVSLLCGRLEAGSGTITFDGRDITRLPDHARVGIGIAYTFQITSVFRELSVYQNVALAAQRRHGGAGLRTCVMEILAQVGLEGLADKPAGNQSYGHQRLLEVAMGLALAPKLLILDEPTQGLAETEIEGFVSLIREVAKNATVLLIEHNIDVVMALADRITVLAEGRVLAEGTPDEIRADDAVQTAYLGA